MKLASGHEVEVLEGEELAKQMKDFHGYTDGLVRLTPGRWLFPKPYLRFADKYFKFEVPCLCVCVCVLTLTALTISPSFVCFTVLVLRLKLVSFFVST